MPLSVSSCSSVAVLRLSGCPSAGAAGRARAAAPAATPPRGARSGTSTWRPSSSFAARLSPPRSARRVAPPARADGVIHARARGQPVDARIPYRARDVHHDATAAAAAPSSTSIVATGAAPPRRIRPVPPSCRKPEHHREQRRPQRRARAAGG